MIKKCRINVKRSHLNLNSCIFLAYGFYNIAKENPYEVIYQLLPLKKSLISSWTLKLSLLSHTEWSIIWNTSYRLGGECTSKCLRICPTLFCILIYCLGEILVKMSFKLGISFTETLTENIFQFKTSLKGGT